MTDDQIVRVTVSLRPKQVKILEKVQDNYDLDRSAAVRFILNDWGNDLSNLFWRDGSEVAELAEKDSAPTL